MHNFFITKDKILDDKVTICGNDFNHVKNVLRMKVGDKFLVSCNNVSHLCQLESFESDLVVAKICQKNYQDTSLPIKIHLFQGLPKSDKMELIIQKAVELGVDTITPVQMERCVVKLDDKKSQSKISRWNAIAESAAKQSKRTCIPSVENAISIKELLKKLNTFDLFLVPYENENGMLGTAKTLKEINSNMNIGVLIGPEGGFSDIEIEQLKSAGARLISLGKRILRTETAAITSIAMLMLYAEINLA